MYQNTYMLDKLSRQKEEIENLIKSYQNTQAPVNNFINTGQTSPKEFLEWHILNENEEVDNLYVNNKTLFIGENRMVLKGVDGSLQKWDIKKTYPIDKKDEKISQLEEEIKKLKEMMENEPTKSSGSVGKCNKSNAVSVKYDDTSTKTNGSGVSKQTE